MYGLHKLLWDIRNVPAVNLRFTQDPEAVLDEYDVAEPMRTHMRDLDFRAMYDAGVNPYLLYFCAIQLEVERAAYYAQLREERTH